MAKKVKKTHRQRCLEERTRDVIFLFQYRHNKQSFTWHTEGVWLDRDEAEAHGQAHHYNYGKDRWRVYGVPANGELAEILKSIDAKGTSNGNGNPRHANVPDGPAPHSAAQNRVRADGLQPPVDTADAR